MQQPTLQWTLATTSKAVRNAEYAVRGTLAIRAEALKAELQKDAGKGSRPFKQIVACNIGNPQQLGQLPITFLRQVAALVEYPALLESESRATALALFAPDAIARAERLLQSIGSVGAYSNSQGIPLIRQDVARFIEARDDVEEVDPANIFLTAGASGGVAHVLQCLIDGPDAGILVPVPNYPLYTATISLCGGRAVPYLLDEASDWTCHLGSLGHSIRDARAAGTRIRAMCIINPGNPTGGLLTWQAMRDLIHLAHAEQFVLLADEVYQDNVHADNGSQHGSNSGNTNHHCADANQDAKKWTSFRRELAAMPLHIQRTVQLVSFHSVSKGVLGECGRRGGYYDCINIETGVLEQLYKLASISLCPSVQGQVAVHVLVCPPQSGDVSQALYESEVNAIKASLRRRAVRLCSAFNALEGVTCRPAAGAMYLFPKITVPPRAMAAAATAGIEPDTLYALELLEATGLCVVPGSGFLQAPGTLHIRTTFLPPENTIDAVIGLMEVFHAAFMQKYSS